MLAVNGEDGGLLSLQCHVVCLGELIFGETGDEVGFAHFFGALSQQQSIQRKHKSTFEKHVESSPNNFTTYYCDNVSNLK